MRVLRYIRLDRGLKQAELGVLTGIPQPIISLIEVGRWNPTAEELGRIAKALGITPPSRLLHEMPDPAEAVRS